MISLVEEFYFTTFSWLQLLIAWISFKSSSMLENKISDKSPIPKVNQPRIPFLQIDSFDGTSFIARGAQCCLDHGSCAHPYHLLQLVVFGLRKEYDFRQSILKVEFKDSHRKLSQSVTWFGQFEAGGAGAASGLLASAMLPWQAVLVAPASSASSTA